MRKLLGIVLCFVLLASLAACNSNSEKNSAGDEAQPGTKESQQLVIWAWDQNLPSIEFAKEKYKAAHPDTNIEVVVQNVPDTVDKMSTFFASGIAEELPDLVLMDNNQIQTFLQQFPDKFVNLSKMGYDEFENDFSEAHWQLLSLDGSIYAFPFDIAPIMMEVNTEILEKANIKAESLVTWDDMIAATSAINTAGFAMHVKLTENDLIGMMQTAGVGIFNENREIDLLNPKVVEAVKIFMDLVKNNTSDAVIVDQSTFGEGKVATMMKPAWAIGEDMPAQVDISGKVTLIPMPKLKDAEGYNSSANNGGSSFFILETSKVKEEAYEIGKYITTELESQKIALAQGLMPGFLPAAELAEVKSGIDYYNGEAIWLELLNSAADTKPLSINEFYSAAKDILKNTLVDSITVGTDKTAEELLAETSQLIADQTGLTVKKY